MKTFLPLEDSFRLKIGSERLLEIAKSAVEIAVETNEREAINFINSKSND